MAPLAPRVHLAWIEEALEAVVGRGLTAMMAAAAAAAAAAVKEPRHRGGWSEGRQACWSGEECECY